MKDPKLKKDRAGSFGVANSINIFDRVVIEVFKCGLTNEQIARSLGVPIKAVERITAGLPKPEKVNTSLAMKILYSADMPVAADTLVQSEKERFSAYCTLESKCLQMMNSLLDYYNTQPLGVDLREDRFKASLAKDFITSTHNVRAELLRKYEIDKTAESKDANKITVEFIESAVDVIDSKIDAIEASHEEVEKREL